MKSTAKKSAPPHSGDIVLVLRTPAHLETWAEPESRRAFALAVGHRFEVQGKNSAGWLELEVGRVVDRVIGGFMNTIWIEPSCVRIIRHRKIGVKK